MSGDNHLTVLFPEGSEESQIDHLLQDAIHSVNQSWSPPCNAFEDDHGFTVQLALPGLDVNQIDVQVEQNVLRVKGERRQEESDR